VARFGWLVVLAACSGGSGTVEGVTFTAAAAPGVGTISFTTEASGEARVVFGVAEDALDQETPSVAASGGTIEVRGLRLGTEHWAKVVVTDGDDETESDVISFTIDPPPAGVPSFNVNSWDPSLSCMDGGHVLFSYLGQNKSGVAVVNRDARYVWAVASDAPDLQIGRVRPGRDGQSLVWNVFDQEKEVDLGEIVRLSFDGATRTDTRTVVAHHDFVELPDGSFSWLSYDRRVATNPDDPKLGDEDMSAESVHTGPEGATDETGATQLWNQWDDYPQGVYTIPEEADEFLNDGSLEIGHANSLAYVPEQDAYYVMWRWLDTMVKIGGDGSYQWQWGGPFNDLAGDDATLFEHSHFSEVWDGGMLMFDNRNSADGSRLVEYTFDDTSFEEVWSYETGDFENLLGDVRRMPVDGCDNVLVSYSNQGRLLEITRDGEIAWDIGTSGIGNITSRLFFVPDLYDLNSAQAY
jgi:hypothetical protein